MPYRYFSDEPHIKEWLTLTQTEAGTQEYLDRYVFGVKDFGEYLERVGGVRRMNKLKRVEDMLAPIWGEEE
jgi:hypothetical protein